VHHWDMLGITGNLGQFPMETQLRRACRRLTMPSTWKVWTRRLFVVAFPVTLPVWLLLIFAANLALSFVHALDPIGRFWNAPPRRFSSYGYGEYRSRAGTGAKVVELPLPEKDAA
jgi:hypothetical protein